VTAQRRYTVRPSKVYAGQWVVFDREKHLVVASGFEARQRACGVALEFTLTAQRK
jgi:hypothetical protein